MFCKWQPLGSVAICIVLLQRNKGARYSGSIGGRHDNTYATALRIGYNCGVLMHIAFVIPYFYPAFQYGGQPKSSYDLARALSRADTR